MPLSLSKIITVAALTCMWKQQSRDGKKISRSNQFHPFPNFLEIFQCCAAFSADHYQVQMFTTWVELPVKDDDLSFQRDGISDSWIWTFIPVVVKFLILLNLLFCFTPCLLCPSWHEFIKQYVVFRPMEASTILDTWQRVFSKALLADWLTVGLAGSGWAMVWSYRVE